MSHNLTHFVQYLTLLFTIVGQIYYKLTRIKVIVFYYFDEFDYDLLGPEEVGCEEGAVVAVGALKGEKLLVGDELTAAEVKLEKIETLGIELFHM
jgi:hypothetical protein